MIYISISLICKLFKFRLKMTVILTLTGHRSNINYVDTHPTDPKYFVTCSYDK